MLLEQKLLEQIIINKNVFRTIFEMPNCFILSFPHDIEAYCYKTISIVIYEYL